MGLPSTHLPPRPSREARSQALADLRALVRAVEKRPAYQAVEDASADVFGCPLGADEADAHLPAGGLEAGGAHEIVAASSGDAPAACGFTLAALSRFHQSGPRAGAPLAWIANRAAGLDAGALYGPGLACFGLDPADLIVIETRRDEDALRALEDCARAGVLAGVAAQLKDADFTATRRLALAAEQSGSPAFLLMPHGRNGATAARTRWRISAAPSAPLIEAQGRNLQLNDLAPGRARWRAVLERCRDGRPADWLMEWDDETRALRVAAELAPRPARTQPAERQPRRYATG